MAVMGFSPRRANACVVKEQGNVINKRDTNSPSPAINTELVDLKTQPVIREATQINTVASNK